MATFGNANEVIQIGDCFPLYLAKNSEPCDFRLLRHNRPQPELCTAARIPSLYYLHGAHEQRRRYIEYRALGHFRSAHNHGVLSDPGTERPMKALESGGLRKAAERMA